MAITLLPMSGPLLAASPDMSKAHASAKSLNTPAVASELSLANQADSVYTDDPPVQKENVTCGRSNLSSSPDKTQVSQENGNISCLAINETNHLKEQRKSHTTGLARIGTDESLAGRPDSCHVDFDILNRSINFSGIRSPNCTLKQFKKEHTDTNTGDIISLPQMKSLKPDKTLTFTCQGRCGKEISFPCSCSASCVVYGTCCDNITQDCPHVLEEGMTRFDRMLGADIVCHEDFIYMISSCPSSPRKSAKEKGVTFSSTQTPAVKNSNINLESQIPKLNDVGTNLGTTDIFGLDTGKSSKSGREVQESIVERLKLALSAAPVTDSDTGFTFINKSIYECNNMSQSTALTWSVASAYTAISPVILEDLGRLNFLNRYQFEFEEEIFMAHQCKSNVVETCDENESPNELNQIYAEKCQESNALIVSKNVHYRNIFCGFCNEGSHDKYRLVLEENISYRHQGFQILMSISESGTINVRLSKLGMLSWSHAHCPIPDHKTELSSSSRLIEEWANADSDQRAVCSTTCQDNYFKAPTDGLCKTERRALLAIANDGLSPLCPSAMKGLANFLVCGLKSEVKSLNHSDWSAQSVSVMFDASTNKTLYVVEINLAVIMMTDRIFSHLVRDAIPNTYHVAILVQTFRNYRFSNGLCPKQKLINQHHKPGLRIIRTSTLESYLDRASFNLTKGMEQLRGPIINKQNTTTVCLTPVYFAKKPELKYLKCMEDPVHERDKSLVHDFRGSPCFSYLENLELPDTNGAVTAQKRDAIFLMRVLAFTILMVLLVKIKLSP
ncbi:hypothetical protein PoB_004636400 [Plakobranchus ocellatus]|uniref:SMB domain-containing protein n=1 Tax=Plakobranchus ocellatus TaxID=259542 RepID=A0AAV4BNH1_9GAST|nr:hypothetical protein PoB_004636400 [Plakobranchus ocellatus]